MITHFSHFEAAGKTTSLPGFVFPAAQSPAPPRDSSTNERPLSPQRLPNLGGRLCGAIDRSFCLPYSFRNKADRAQRPEETCVQRPGRKRVCDSRGLVDSGGHHAHEHHVEDGVVELQVPLDGQDQHASHGLHRHHRH